MGETKQPENPNNIPIPISSFVGREEEIADVKTLLGKTRLLTLTGVGGGDKILLDLQVAKEVLEQFPDGVWLVELTSLTDPALVPQRVASALGIQKLAGQSLEQTLVDSLKPRRLLLLLANCEHLLNACAKLTSALLNACPNVKVLATSRKQLRVTGELTYNGSKIQPHGLRHIYQSIPNNTLVRCCALLFAILAIYLSIRRCAIFPVSNEQIQVAEFKLHKSKGLDAVARHAFQILETAGCGNSVPADTALEELVQNIYNNLEIRSYALETLFGRAIPGEEGNEILSQIAKISVNLQQNDPVEQDIDKHLNTLWGTANFRAQFTQVFLKATDKDVAGNLAEFLSRKVHEKDDAALQCSRDILNNPKNKNTLAVQMLHKELSR